jgi:hypothetical protein
MYEYETDYVIGDLQAVRIGDETDDRPMIYADCEGEGSGDPDYGCDAVDGS